MRSTPAARLALIGLLLTLPVACATGGQTTADTTEVVTEVVTETVAETERVVVTERATVVDVVHADRVP